jgi:N-acetylmuramoyl-L-alanine amidase
MYLNILPLQTAQASDAADKIQMQSALGYDEQQVPDYLINMKFYLGSVDSMIAAQTLSAVKQFQAQYGSTADGAAGEQTAGVQQKQISPAPASPPSSGEIVLSSQDLDYLAHAIYGEARGEPYEGKVAVASVVLNRVESAQFGNSIREVIMQPGAFTALRDGQYYLQPDDASYEAAKAAFNGWDPTNGAVYYWNPVTATDEWVHTRTIIKTIGNHVFAI